LLFLASVASLSAACGGSAPTSSDPAASVSSIGDSWTPPVGIPMPSFGVREQPGPATWFVDNTHPSATDDGNPQGSAARPRRTLPGTLPAGAVVEIKGGPYVVGRVQWGGDGSAASPIFVRGVGSPVLDGEELRLRGSYVIVEGVVLDGMRLVVGPGHHLALRRSEIRGYDPGRNGAAVSLEATDVVLQGNHIHHNGDATGAAEEDVHGIKPGSGDARVWIVDNNIHHNGGDAVQVGSASAEEPWAERIYIGRNELHHDRENGVDIKQSRDVVVSENRIHSYLPTSSSSGEAIVVHDDPERVWIVNNEIRDAARGVVCTGAAGFYVVGNLIERIHHVPGREYDPASLYGTQAIIAYASPELHVVANTIYDVDAGISFPTGQRAVIVGNVVANLSQPSHHVAVGGSAAGSSLMSHNLLAGPVRIKWGTTRAQGLSEFQGSSGRGAGCVTGDPAFQDPGRGDFRLRTGSPAIDAGITPDVYATFQRLYGLDIARDLASTPRPQGRAFDIGALEHRQ
jgi:nitrous oxidase accessory protein NosD